MSWDTRRALGCLPLDQCPLSESFQLGGGVCLKVNNISQGKGGRKVSKAHGWGGRIPPPPRLGGRRTMAAQIEGCQDPPQGPLSAQARLAVSLSWQVGMLYVKPSCGILIPAAPPAPNKTNKQTKTCHLLWKNEPACRDTVKDCELQAGSRRGKP